MCQCTHVQNRAYANKSRRTYVCDVRQLLNRECSCVFTVEFAQISMPGEVVMAQLLQFTFPFNE